MTRARMVVLALLVLLSGLVATPGALGHGGWRSYVVTAHDAETPNGTVGWFTVDNRTGANPTIPVHPNETVIVHFVNVGSRNHTLEIGAPVDVTIGPVPPGNESSASFEIPPEASGLIRYQDPAWAERGMQAAFRVNGTVLERSTPAPGAGAGLLGLAGAAALQLAARRRR